jgi:hypothetical protein
MILALLAHWTRRTHPSLGQMLHAVNGDLVVTTALPDCDKDQEVVKHWMLGSDLGTWRRGLKIELRLQSPSMW